MVNVLHIMAGADAGGISAVVLNYYEHIDRSKVHFDIALTTDSFGLNGQRLDELGADFYRITLKSKDKKKYKSDLMEILGENRIDVIHVHENSTSFYALKIAKKCGIKKRIAHAHTASPDNTLINSIKRIICQLLNYYYSTSIVACGQLAGDSVFGKYFMKQSKAMILPNAIDPNRYSFNVVARDKIRKEFSDTSKFIIGMIGRLSPEKNHRFAFQIIRSIKEIIPNVVLYVVGNGELDEELKKLANTMQIGSYIRFLGRRNDVGDLLSAFDVLILPSIFEGFPVTAVEAIGAGLPVLLSNSITPEFVQFENVSYESIKDSELWVNKLIELYKNRDLRTQVSLEGTSLDINVTAEKLQNLYCS